MNSSENTRIEYFIPQDIWRKIIHEFLLTNHKKYWTTFKRNDFMLEDLTKYHVDKFSQNIYNYTSNYLDKELIINSIPSICYNSGLILETIETLYNLLEYISNGVFVLYSRYNIVKNFKCNFERRLYKRNIKDTIFACINMCNNQRNKSWDNWIGKVSGKNRVKTLELLDKIHLKTYELEGNLTNAVESMVFSF